MATVHADSDNGDDTTGDGSFGNPWKTLNKAGESGRSAGDLIILRRGRTATYSDGGDFDPVTNGTPPLPIIVEADYGNLWSDDANSAQTYTTVFGAKTMTASGSITGIVTGDWVYVTGDDQRVDCWEVAGVSGTTLTLYLPFKGTVGSGLTLVIMEKSPVYSSTGSAGSMDMNKDFWTVRGVHGKSNADSWVMSASQGVTLEHCAGEALGTSDTAFSMSSAVGPFDVSMFRCRAFNYDDGGVEVDGGELYAKECLFDGNNVAGSTGLHVLSKSSRVVMEECEFKNHASADLAAGGSVGMIAIFRNCTFSSGTLVESNLNTKLLEFYFEDFNNTPGDTRQILQRLGSVSPIIESDAVKVRAGGGDISIKVTPADGIGAARMSELEILNIPIKLPASAKTVTVYFASDTTTEWTTGPTAAELTIELSYFGHATNKYRRLEVSTGTVDFTTDTDFDQTLAVTVTPALAGNAYLRVIYRKAKESGKTNIFNVDTKVDIS